MAVICASVKRAELLQPGDVVNLNGAGSSVSSKVILGSFVKVFLTDGTEKSFDVGSRIEYVTAEQWAAL